MAHEKADASTNAFYPFKAGTIDCIAISDGSHDYALDRFFANVQREQVVRVLREHGWPIDHVTTPYTCLYVNTGKNQIMVDVGADSYFANAHKLATNLKIAGISANDIDTVVITHAHPDHIGGLLDEADQLVFPNAQYYMARREWEFWLSDSAASQAPKHFVELARKHFGVIQHRVTLVDGGEAIVAGMQAIPAPGHTPGHMALSIRSEDAQLLHVSDVVLSPLHLEYPTWVPIYDMDSEMAERSKYLIFERAAEENALVFAHHFPPFPNLGHVFKHENAWRWQPIELST